MKRVILFFLIFGLFTCSHKQDFGYSYRCHEKRLGIDVGSGSTKLVFAEVDTCKNKLLKILEEKNITLKFKETLHLNNMRLSEKIFKKVKRELTTFLSQNKINTQQARGVATQVFREAKNGDTFINRLGRETGIRIKIITQKEEAALGFYAVTGITNKDPNNILVWDIGGGSTQITYKKGGDLISSLGTLASVSFKNYILKEKNLSRGTPNPIGLYTAVRVTNHAYMYAKKNISFEFKEDIKGKEVIGIGGVHYYSIRKQLKKQRQVPYSLFEVNSTSNTRVSWPDTKLESPYKETEVSNLLLVSGFMKALNINTVLPLKVNLATGVLFNSEMW